MSITLLKASQLPICNGIHPPKKSVAAMLTMIKRFTYSAKKKNANLIPEYSVWKPAVSSDSASARSNGPRLVSAVPAIRNMIKAIQTGRCPLKIHQPSACEAIISLNCKLPEKTITTSNDKSGR